MTTASNTLTLPDVPFGHVEPIMVHFDDLDMMGIVHNAKYALLLERALTPFWADRGFAYENGQLSVPDMFHAVVELSVSFRAPIRGTGPILAHFWFERFGTTSAEYRFRLLSADGGTLHAEGRRAIVRLDPATLRPTPWTEDAIAVGKELLRPESATL
ncbi:acyl-CoA thioesterase [Micromonospora sp. NPDC004704]